VHFKVSGNDFSPETGGSIVAIIELLVLNNVEERLRKKFDFACMLNLKEKRSFRCKRFILTILLLPSLQFIYKKKKSKIRFQTYELAKKRQKIRNVIVDIYRQIVIN